MKKKLLQVNLKNMPRTKRQDYEGALHHVICRGIKRDIIFHDNNDYYAFISRLEEVITSSDVSCYAWSLMPNHVHLLLQTKKTPLKKVMASLLTSYAIYFNKRHNRVGHVFQNRYKSILCENDSYFINLIKYIHLNPLRGGVLKSLDQLIIYPFSGHSAMLGLREYPWHDVIYPLTILSDDVDNARLYYMKFVHENDQTIFTETNLSKGVSTISIEDASYLEEQFNMNIGDDLIDLERSMAENKFSNLDDIVEYVSDITKIRKEILLRRNSRRHISLARAMIAKIAYENGGYYLGEIADVLQITPQGVSRILLKYKSHDVSR